MSKIVIGGAHFHRALAYAFQACPKSEGKERMSHVVFVENKIVCADGERYHVGILPEDAPLEEAIAVSRESVDQLLLALNYAGRVARRRSVDYSVTLEISDGKEGREAEARIKYGAKREIVHELELVDVGEIPSRWVEPVAEDAPLLEAGEAPEIDCDHMRSAVLWYRSWEKNHGSFVMRGLGGLEWVRMDITCNGDHVASAFILPVGSPPAQLPHDEPLFKGKDAIPRGQSVLSLSLDLDAPPIATTLVVEGAEINVTGIADPERLRVTKCRHGEKQDGCSVCTKEAVETERKAIEAAAKEESKVTPIRRGRNKKAEKEAAAKGGDGADA